MDPVALPSRADAPAVASGFLPPERPLEMPQQSLWTRRDRPRSPATAARSVPLRRLFVFGASIAMTAAAASEMVQVLQVGGFTVLEWAILGLFVLLFAWIALSFVSAVIGFLGVLAGFGRALGIDPRAPLPELTARTALLLPTYNEDPHRVMSRLQAIYEEVESTGRLAHFDFYILSDTTDPGIWVAEETAYLALRARKGDGRIFYRHRPKNVARKAGNVGEWVARFGGHYAHMLVLDADSLMEGDTIVRMTAAMERHPKVGLIQTLPVLINGNTLFARLQQFAGRTYGPLIARGIAWWHGSESNYWGHNAIIRVEAFASQAGLPPLGGRKPFGGDILSHDFVEAALLRRAGWGVHLVPSLGGSYEECPPTLTDYAIRDRRWCQGNLQHAGVLPARGLHWVSRLHLMTGIGGYITSPLWLMFLLVGIVISLQAQFIRPEYFPRGATLFPQWPAQDPVRAAYVFAGTMALLVLPKIMGYVAALPRGTTRRGMGGTLRGFIGMLIETFLSALMAPIMMLMQTRAVGEILVGRDAGWSAQRRGDGVLTRDELLRHYALPTLLGVALAAGAYAVSLPLLLWMSPVVAGLVLAVPVAALTSLPRVGRGLRAAGLLLTPEERDPPAVLRRANALADEAADYDDADPVGMLARRPELLRAHIAMQSEEPRRRGDIDVDRVVALAKIDEATDRHEAVELMTRKELLAALASPDAVRKLMAKPEDSGSADPVLSPRDSAIATARR